MSTTLPMAAMFTRNKLVGWYVSRTIPEVAEMQRDVEANRSEE
jgi:hypothetical protein